MPRRIESRPVARRNLPWVLLIFALSSVALLAVGNPAGVLADPASPIAVTKTANPSPVASGGELTYTITMTNTGGAKLSNLVMTDQVNGVGVVQTPPALPQLHITSSQGTCSQGGANGNVVTCNGGVLNGGATWTVTIRGQVTAADGTILNNTAAVSGTKSAQTFNTTATVQVPVDGGTGGGSPLPDLTINKTGPSSVAAGALVKYTLTVNNVGTENTANVRVVDTVPTGVTGITASGTSLFVCDVVGQTVTCDGGAVNAGANATITIDGTAPGTAGQITNTAVVDPNDTISESNELNNTSATVYTNVGDPPSQPLLSILKTDGEPTVPGTWWTGAGPDPVTPGQQITYKIQVMNNATGNNSRADDVIVTDGTQGLEASSIVATQVVVNGTVGNFGGCVVTAPQVRCSIRSLNAGGTLTVTITGTVISSAGSTIFNTATVTGNIKNTGITSTDSEATTVKPAVDLTITKADGPDPVCARSWPIDGPPNQHLDTLDVGLGSDASGTPTNLLAPPVCLGGLTYSFVVGNSGIQDATSVVVRDPLPAGLIFDSYSTDAGFICSVDAGNVITCSGGTIPAESIGNLAFRLVAPATLGSITNTVYIDPNNAIFEPDETNNTAVATTSVATGVDLVIWKSDSVQADPPGDGAPTLIPGTGVAPTGLGDGFDPIATSGTQTVTIYVDNVGTQDTTGIRLRDTLPAGTRFLSVIADPTHGFTCSHDGSATGGTVECVGGHLLGTESEFYDPAGPPPAGPGDDFATIKIRFFARPEVGTMHNEARVDPLNEIAEVNELNNLATDDTVVTVGDFDKGAYHQLTVKKTHVSPANGNVATNGTLIYDLEVANKGTDPISNVVVRDTLPAGTRFIEVKDTLAGTSDAFSCVHDGAATGGVITCTGGDLNGSLNTIPGVAGTVRHITVKVFAPDTPGTYTNQADVDPANAVPEGNEFDNNTQVDTLVAPCVGQADCSAKNAFYELTIEKTQVSPTPPQKVAQNGVITYELKITNLGSDPVYGVAVKDTLPAGSRLIDAQDTGPAGDPNSFICGEPDATNTLTCTGGTLDGTGETLGAGVAQDRTIRIRVFAPDTPATYPNQSRVDPANTVPEGNEFNNTSNLNTGVEPCADQATCAAANAFYELTITKEQNRATIARNGLETYTLTITNWGSDPISDIVVQDKLPVGATLLDAKDTAAPASADDFTCGAPDASNVITCSGGDLSGTAVALPGIPTSRQIVLRVFMPDLPGTYPNEAIVDPFNAIPEGNEFNNVATVETVVQNGGPTPWIDLTIAKTGPSQAKPGGQVVYDLTVTNDGEGDAFNVTVLDVLPANTTFFAAYDFTGGAGSFACSYTAPDVTCTGGTIPAGGSRQIRVLILAPTNIAQYVQDQANVSIFIVNQAFVDPYNAIPEGDESNNADQLETTVSSVINLTLEKQGPGSASQNQTTTYTITVKNEKIGPDGDTAFNVHIVDSLPVGLIPLNITAEPGNFICTLLENPVNTVDCVGDLETDTEVTITIDVFVTADGGQLDNEACVDPDNLIDETNELDNCKHAISDVVPPTPDISINKTVSSGTATEGEELTYTLAVSNVGTGDAAGPVTVTDTLPTQVTLTNVANITPDGGWDCSASTLLVVSCTRPDLTQGATSSITVAVTVNAGVTAPFTNTATVTGGGTDNNPSNNTDSVTTQAGPVGVDLQVVSVTDTPDPVNRSNQLTYTIVATNNGTATANGAAEGAVVRVDFPDTGVTVQGVAGTNGFICSDNGDGTWDCAGNFPAGGTTTITAIVTVDPAAPNSLLLTATVDPANVAPESDETNNSQSATTTVSGNVCTGSPCVDLVVAEVFDSPDPVSNGGTFTYVVSIVNVGDSPVDPTAAWEIHFQYFGSGSPTLTIPAGVTCAVVLPIADHHVHCTGQAGVDGMDLGPGDGLTFTVTVTGGAPGAHSLNVVADIFDVISEFSESNNSVTESTTMNP